MAQDMVPPQVREAMKDVKHKIVILSGKGGVGKTTVATNLAMSFAKKGKSVGLLDVDIYGPNVPKLLGLEGQHPIAEDQKIHPVIGPLGVKVMSMGFLLRKYDDAIAWRGPLVGKAISQFLSDVTWGELDVLVVDLPPGTGDEILSILQQIPNTDGVVIISTPQEVAVLDARRAVQLVKKMDVPVLGIIENMKINDSTFIFNYTKEKNFHYLGSVSYDWNLESAIGFPDKLRNISFMKDFEKVVEKL